MIEHYACYGVYEGHSKVVFELGQKAAVAADFTHVYLRWKHLKKEFLVSTLFDYTLCCLSEEFLNAFISIHSEEIRIKLFNGNGFECKKSNKDLKFNLVIKKCVEGNR